MYEWIWMAGQLKSVVVLSLILTVAGILWFIACFWELAQAVEEEVVDLSKFRKKLILVASGTGAMGSVAVCGIPGAILMLSLFLFALIGIEADLYSKDI